MNPNLENRLGVVERQIDAIQSSNENQTNILNRIDVTLRGSADGEKEGLYSLVKITSDATHKLASIVEVNSRRITQLEQEGFKAKTLATVAGGLLGAGGITLWDKLAKFFGGGLSR